MIQLKLEANGKYYYYDPLEKLIIPNGYQLNENLQHQETQVSLRIAYNSELHKILVENQNIPARLVDDDKILFTGTIDSGISWTDNGNPEPLDCFNITIFDNSGKLQATTESEFAMINKSLTEIIVAICDKCGIICSRTNFPVDDPIVPVFILPAEKEFYQPLSDLLFEYGYAFGFDNNGYFGLINLTQPQSATFHDDLYTGVKFSRTKKKYTGLSVTYGQLVKKNNEQVFFGGGDLDAENKILPIVIQPGAYYPWESDPIIEADEGQVFQQFATGFAEEKTLYNGEKKYQRNNNSKLIYTTNHELVPDFSSNLTVDRKEFSFTQASIRFHNASTTDATLKQLAIRATAYYRQEQQIILGSGKKFEYQTNYLYNKAKTDAFVEILKKYFLGGNFKITFKTDAEFIPGTKTKLNTGLSGITADVLILSCEKDFDNENYTINAITIQDISLDEKKYQTQKSMTADQLIQRTEYTTTAIKTIQEEYYQSTSRTELIGGKWQTIPPTPSTNTYIWTRTHFIYSDGAEVTTDPISVSGENGDKIESVDVEYAQNQSRTTAPTSDWQTTAPTAKDGYYTWSRTKIKLKDKDATYTDAVCITGDKGNTGDSGVGVSSITNYYLATNATSVTTSTTGWTTTIQTVSATKKYLWNYEKITYTDNTEKSTTPVIIGNYSANGTNGKDGSDGIGIKSIAEKYAVSTSNTIAPTTWKDTPPQMTATNKYLWNYEIITYTNNTTEETAKRVIGAYGDKGATGEQGVRGSLEFSGTEINAISDITEATYTITTASTGIISATMPILVGDTYINVTTQDVWICSTAGTPTTAKWKYLGRRCSDKDDSNRFRMFTPATDNGTMQITLTKSVVKGENPFGKIDDLLKITNTNGTSGSLYGPYYRRTKIDPKKTYRHVTYIKQEDANYSDYIGIARWESENSFCLSLSGSPIKAAYFTSAHNFGTLGRWYMIVGYIVANGTTTAPTDSGVYDMVTKQKVRDVTNYQWKSNVAYCTNSGCLIRYTASASTKTGTAFLYDIRLDEVNGTEPTLNELLNLDTTTKSKGAWASSTVYNTGDIVYLNGNSYICIANHTSGTSFSTTNWNLIASKGADGKNAITMTSATTPAGEYNGQIGIWRGQVYNWNGTDWVLTSGILPTDPVLHYSFDELPEIPDGTNNFMGRITGVAYTKEDIKGGYRFTLNGVDPYIHFVTDIGAVDSLTLCYRQKAISKTGGYYSNEAYIFYTDRSYSSISSFIPYPTESDNIVRTTIPCDKTKTVAYIRLDMFSGKSHSAVIDVTDMYIGDALYTTPVIDNSGNNHNATDVKGLVTKGVSGKCFNFNGVNTSFITQSPSLGGEISFSFWIKLQNKGFVAAICQSRASVGGGFSIFYISNILRFDYGGFQCMFDKFVPAMEELYHIVITQAATVKTLFVDGVKIQQVASSLVDAEYSQYMWFGLSGSNLNKPTLSGDALQGSLDDFQIFDRALSDQEVLGLYLARGNTPKKYTMADYQLDNSSGKYYGYEKPAVPFKNDTYLDTTTGYLYEYDGVKWVAITDVTDSRYNQAVNDMIAFATNKPTLPFLTARNAWIERLAVDGLLANKIATQELKIRDGGSIHSDNYNGTIQDGVITESGTEGWAIDSDGTAEFNNGVIKTPELNFYGVSGIQNNKIEDAFFLKSLFSDFGGGVYDNHIFRSNGVNTDLLFISSYIGTSYEMSFSGTLSIYLAKYENIFISISCKSVIFKVVKTKVIRNKNSAFPSYKHEVMATQAFTENYSNNWVCGVSNKIINIDVNEGDLITCYIEGLYSAPLFEAATMYANSITSDGLFIHESAMCLGKTNTLVKKLLIPSESVFNSAIIATKASGINNIQGVGNFAKYVLIGNVLIQWGQTLSYTVPPGQRFEEIINLPVAYVSSGDVLGSGATGLSGYNVIMSSSAKDVDGGFEYNESWASRTNSSFKIRAYNRNGNTTIERWSLRWLTIGYIN